MIFFLNTDHDCRHLPQHPLAQVDHLVLLHPDITESTLSRYIK